MDSPPSLVNEEQLRAYLQTFFSVLAQSAERLLSQEAQALLLHLHYTPALITGYISRTYGLAIELIPHPQTTTNVISVDERVEDAVFHAPPALSQLPTSIKCAHNTIVGNCEFGGTFPARLSGDDAYATLFDLDINAQRVTPGLVDKSGRSLGGQLTIGWPNAKQDEAALRAGDNVTIYGLRLQLAPSLFEHYAPMLNALGDWKTHIFLAQIYSDRSSSRWTELRAMEHAKDQIILAVIEQNKAKERNVPIDEYIATHKQRTVLLLGDYDVEGTLRLEAIKAVLCDMGYNPLLLKDVPDHFHQDLSHKVLSLASLARFVVVDDTSKSGHLAEVEICWKNHFYTVLLHARGHRASFMTAAASTFSKVIIDQEYDPANPTSGLAKAVDAIESALKGTSDALRKIYPWRIPPPS